MGLERNFVGDPHAFEGYWGPPTSVANFCEEDYGVTLYIGEFVNTFTNLAYGRFIIGTSNNHDNLTACEIVYWSINELFPGESLFSTTAFPNLALFFVGVMSFAFHLTLKYGAQLCDDLSMFWVCAAIIYELYTVDQPPKVKVAFGSALTAVLGTISAIHCTLYQLWLHNWTFVLLVTAIWPRVLYLIQRKFKGEEKKYWLAKFRVGGISFVAGFIVWVIDSAACGQLREARRAVGPPWAFVLELHGWWHILTAVGAGYCVRVTKVLTKRSS